MNSQKTEKITKQKQKLHIEDKIYLWILGSPDISTAMYIDIWQRIVKSQRRNEIQESVINMTR